VLLNKEEDRILFHSPLEWHNYLWKLLVQYINSICFICVFIISHWATDKNMNYIAVLQNMGYVFIKHVFDLKQKQSFKS